MEQIFALMAYSGAFTFVSIGFSEAKESKKTANRMTIIMVLGILSFLVGFFGLITLAILE